MARFPKTGIVNRDSSGIKPPIIEAPFSKKWNCEPRFLRNRSTSRLITIFSDSEMSAGRGRPVSRSPAPSGPMKVPSSQGRLMPPPPSVAWAAASPRQRRSRDSDGFQLEGDDELEDHQVRMLINLRSCLAYPMRNYNEAKSVAGNHWLRLSAGIWRPSKRASLEQFGH